MDPCVKYIRNKISYEGEKKNNLDIRALSQKLKEQKITSNIFY